MLAISGLGMFLILAALLKMTTAFSSWASSTLASLIGCGAVALAGVTASQAGFLELPEFAQQTKGPYSLAKKRDTVSQSMRGMPGKRGMPCQLTRMTAAGYCMPMQHIFKHDTYLKPIRARRNPLGTTSRVPTLMLRGQVR